MLRELRINGLGVIADAVLPLHPGLTVLTGETGAGKTMVVQGLGLVMGARGEVGQVRPGSTRALVEALLAVQPGTPLAGLLDDLGAEAEEGDVLVARQVGSEGRSRAWLGGRSVPLSALADVAALAVAVHGQSDQVRLLRPAEQRSALDRLCGQSFAAELAAYQQAYVRRRAVSAELDRVRASSTNAAAEAQHLTDELVAIEAVRPLPGEDEQLRAEARRLSEVTELRAAAEEAHQALVGADDGQPEQPGAAAILAQARRALSAVGDADPVLRDLGQRTDELVHLVTDLAADLGQAAAGLEADPARLAAVEERRSRISALTRRHGPSVEDLLAWESGAAARLMSLDAAPELVSRLDAELADLTEEVGRRASRLSELREAAAGRMEAEVSRELADLAMPHARLTAAISQSDSIDGVPFRGRTVGVGPQGADEVELLLRPHPGVPARAIARGASGGELSRVMLALEVVLAAGGAGATLVFDEVDAGVGGRAAVEIGKRLARLAVGQQVLCVTHLPQVAAFADSHLLVEKATDGTVTQSGVRQLSDSERTEELSRMLAGLEGSDLARGHARELLDLAAETRRAVRG